MVLRLLHIIHLAVASLAASIILLPAAAFVLSLLWLHCCISQIIVGCCLLSLSNQLSNSYVSPCSLLPYYISLHCSLLRATLSALSSFLIVGCGRMNHLSRAYVYRNVYVVAFGLGVVCIFWSCWVWFCWHDGQFVFLMFRILRLTKINRYLNDF